MSEIKSILYRLNNRLYTAKENISELEDITMETIQNKIQRKKKDKKNPRALVSCGTTPRGLIISWSP